MKKLIFSAYMSIALMVSFSASAQDTAKKEGCPKAKTECKKDSECTKKEDKKECCKKETKKSSCCEEKKDEKK